MSPLVLVAQVQVHRFILAACSSLFLGMLRNLPPNPVVFLRGVDRNHLLLVLDFMYHGEVSIQQKELPAFLRTAEDLQVKGLIEKEDSEHEQETVTQNSDARKINQELPDLFLHPSHLKSNAEEQNIGQELINKRQTEDPCTKTVKNKKTDGKRAIKRAVNNRSANNRREKKCEYKSRPSSFKSTKALGMERESPLFPEVSQEQVKVQGMIQNEINATESEIEQREGGLVEEEKRENITDDYEEVEEPSLMDTTDSTISEVENMLKETRRLLREETGISPTKKLAATDQSNTGIVCAPGKNVVGVKPLPDTRRMSESPSQSLRGVSTGQVKSTRNQSHGTTKKPQNGKFVNSNTTLRPNRPSTPQTATSDATVTTPSKALEQSDKERAIIACLVTKLSSSHGWRCTICRYNGAF